MAAYGYSGKILLVVLFPSSQVQAPRLGRVHRLADEGAA